MPNIIYTFEENNASRQKLGSNGVQNFFGVHELSSSRHFLGKSSFN